MYRLIMYTNVLNVTDISKYIKLYEKIETLYKSNDIDLMKK